MSRILYNNQKQLTYNNRILQHDVMLITQIASANTISIILSGTGSVVFDWGDGTSNTYALKTVSNTTATHTWTGPYANRVKYINVYNVEKITFFVSSDSISLDVRFLINCYQITLSGATNSCYGVVPDSYNLQLLYLDGLNTVTGTIQKLKNARLLILAGLSNFSGYLSDLILTPYYVSIATGNVNYANFNMSKLGYFALSTYVFNNSQQNQILQNVWDNRDVAKNRSERTIDLRGAVGTPTLDSTGLALKNQLINYVTPPGSTTWTILNR